MKYCCDVAYYCPERNAVACYAHGGSDPCCSDERAHVCLYDMYGSEDGLMLGDGFICVRCGNYELTGLEHAPAAEPGFPRKHPPAPDRPELVIFTVEAVFDVTDRAGLLVAGRVGAGEIRPGMTLYNYKDQPVRILTVEFSSEYDANRVTLLVNRADAENVSPESVLKN